MSKGSQLSILHIFFAVLIFYVLVLVEIFLASVWQVEFAYISSGEGMVAEAIL
jgi:hypothetical protein